MAALRKRNGGWRAEVCIKGTRSSAMFTTKREEEETRLREDVVTAHSGACQQLVHEYEKKRLDTARRPRCLYACRRHG